MKQPKAICATPDYATTQIQTYRSFCRAAGISVVTGWRWRKLGWIKTVNIGGSSYITAAAVSEFLRRAEAGEFANVSPVPPAQHATE